MSKWRSLDYRLANIQHIEDPAVTPAYCCRYFDMCEPFGVVQDWLNQYKQITRHKWVIQSGSPCEAGLAVPRFTMRIMGIKDNIARA